MGPMTGCTDAICNGGCQNGGKCAWAGLCDCAPGYSDQSCTTEFCGDGAQSKSEICDDGNFKGNDGCVKCDLENNDPALVWPSNTSLAAQWYILYPPPPPAADSDVVMSYIDTGDGGGVIVLAISLIGLTHVFACCYIGSADTSPVSADAKKEVERLARLS
jgi:cysteine-rich repeat protein